MAILIFIVVLSVLVLVHELGHFLTARRSGIGVHEFGFGFPPRLWGIRRNQVLYSINAIPFGGFVRLVGEGPGEEQAPDSFLRATFAKKLIVLLAGVVMNLILAWVLISTAFAIGIRVDTAALPAAVQTNVSQRTTEVFVSESGAAAKAGLQPGDRLITVNGKNFTSTEQLVAYAQTEDYPVLELKVERQSQIKSIIVQPNTPVDPAKPVYGFGLQQSGLLRYPVWQAPIQGLQTTGWFTIETVRGLGRVASDLVTRGRVSEDVAGPVGIAVLTSEVSRLGLTAVLQFMAVLSISLAVINALPLPALDGGRVLFAVIEAVRGRPVNPRWERTLHSLGFVSLLILIALISVRDVQRFEVWDRIINVFQSRP